MSGAWRLLEPSRGIALLEIDLGVRPVNTLGSVELADLAKVVADLADRRGLGGLLVRSGKPGRCIAGADLKEIAGSDRPGHRLLIEAGHATFRALGELPMPTVGLIDGACLGGGLELFLALDDRLASDSAGTVLGLPEVRLGLMPAWGGTQRLPRLIGAEAVDLIGGGESVRPRRAIRLGLVGEIVPAAALMEAGLQRLDELGRDGSWQQRRKQARGPACREVGRAASRLIERFAACGSGTSGAGMATLAAIRDGSARSLEEGLTLESAAALEVFGTESARSRVAAFLGRRKGGAGA